MEKGAQDGHSADMTTRTAAVRQLLDLASGQIGGAEWHVAGGNRLRAKLNEKVEGIILPLAAGHVHYTISIEVGPRFPAVERIVNKACRAAGLSEAGVRVASVFPTVFDRLGCISPIRDNSPLSETEELISALRTHAVPFILSISTVGAAADYALKKPLAYGAHAMRVPVLLALAGRSREGQDYLSDQIRADGPYTEFLMRYREALVPLL